MHCPNWVRNADPTGPVRQRIDWPYRSWIAEPKLKPYQDWLEAIEDHWAQNDGLDRAWLYQISDGPVMNFFLAVMAWGFGIQGIGASRVRRMLTDSTDLAERIERIRAAVWTDPLSGWDALFAEETRVKHLAVVYGTKLLHFAGFNRTSDLQPLIFDRWVAAGLEDAGMVVAKWNREL